MIPVHFKQFLWHFLGIQLKHKLKSAPSTVLKMQNYFMAVPSTDFTYYLIWISKKNIIRTAWNVLESLLYGILYQFISVEMIISVQNRHLLGFVHFEEEKTTPWPSQLWNGND